MPGAIPEEILPEARGRLARTGFQLARFGSQTIPWSPEVWKWVGPPRRPPRAQQAGLEHALPARTWGAAQAHDLIRTSPRLCCAASGAD